MSETYKLPPEPAVGTVLKDVETGEYTRRTETGWTVFLSARPADTVVGFGGWPNMLARAGGALVEAPPGPVTVPGWRLLEDMGVYAPRRLSRVQARQDKGLPWGEAIKALGE